MSKRHGRNRRRAERERVKFLEGYIEEKAWHITQLNHRLVAMERELRRWLPKVRVEQVPQDRVWRTSVDVTEMTMQHAKDPHSIVESVGDNVKRTLLNAMLEVRNGY